MLNNVDRIGTVLVTDELPTAGPGASSRPTCRSTIRKASTSAATAHVNTAESFNATLKRAWVGIFRWFSIKHTDRYLHETNLRGNARRQDTDTRLADLFTRSTGRLRWKDLTA